MLAGFGDELREQRGRGVVLRDLAQGFLAELLQLREELLLRLLALPYKGELEIVDRDAPLEQRSEDHVQRDVEEILRLPRLLIGDAEDVVADVGILADDVRPRVMKVVVGVFPAGCRGDEVPLPGTRMDLRITHPVPLSVDDVVADLHVLEDLRQRKE